MRKAIVLILLLQSVIHAQGAKPSISIATDGYYPPYSVLKDGELSGYDIDVGKEACRRANLNCKFVVQDFATIIDSIRFKKHDLVMAGITDNDYRRKVIDFTTPYASGSTAFLVKSDSPLKAFCSSCEQPLIIPRGKHSTPQLTEALLDTFKGKVIGVEKNTIMHKFFTENEELNGNFELIFGKDDELYDMVKSGKIDAAFASTSFWEDKFLTAGKDNLTFAGPKITGGFLGYGVAIACRKSDQAIKSALDEVLKSMKEDGTLKKLSEKWFHRDMTPNQSS